VAKNFKTRIDRKKLERYLRKYTADFREKVLAFF